MKAELWLQYGSMAVAILFLLVKRKGMREYIPVGLFASFYANVMCIFAADLSWWHFPSRLVTVYKHISVPANFVVVPIVAMFWVRYFPLRLKEQIFWALLWTTGLTGVEYLLERFTSLLKYGPGYHWYHSYLLWFISWFVWLGFHRWLNHGRKKIDSLFT